MVSMEKAESVVAKLTEEDRIKLRQLIDECLLAAMNFDETGKPEYFVKMKDSMERFMKTLEQLEKEPRTS
ncbi:MAG: hypothetical protein QXZ02_00610 [Candidatus Bathyarchaeia archaeon]